jgi:hypothetical protein
MVFNLRGIFLVAMLATTMGVALARPDLNAFLNYKASTTGQLVAEAQKDPVVMDRYMRHFSMTREQVVTYLSGLHPGTLSQDGVYKIFSIPDGGYVKAHVGKIKKGTKMFFSADNEPALVAICGNPVVEGKTPTLVTIIPTPPVDVADTHPVPPVGTEPEPLLAMAEPGNVELPTVGTDNQHVVPGISAFPLAGLLGLGAFGLVSHNSPHQPVPEPATMLALGLGVTMFVRKRRSK